MRKIIIYIFIALAITVAASAFQEGDILTQQQLDNINASNLNKGNLQCRIEGQWIIQQLEGDRQYLHEFSCLSVEPSGNDYIIIRVVYSVGYLRSERRLYGNQYILDSINASFNSYLDLIRETIRQYQSFDDWLPEWQI